MKIDHLEKENDFAALFFIRLFIEVAYCKDIFHDSLRVLLKYNKEVYCVDELLKLYVDCMETDFLHGNLFPFSLSAVLTPF